MACSASAIRSRGVAGNWMLASAIRNVLIQHPNFIASATLHSHCGVRDAKADEQTPSTERSESSASQGGTGDSPVQTPQANRLRGRRTSEYSPKPLLLESPLPIHPSAVAVSHYKSTSASCDQAPACAE